ncbi:MAG TPA: Uma2 family endonuclease [Pirellulaceae bacterium]|nr:Uma2 family endonuclease [Pirellulaceae bacterium]
MSQVSQARATLDDLMREPGKAELIGGRIVHLMPTGDVPSQIGGNIYVSLRTYGKKTKRGVAYPDGTGFAVKPMLPSGRESFSPDAAFYTGRRPANRMRFLPEPPLFAVEVRSENDYGEAAEELMAEKRADYFAAGTLVVWDVDPVNACIHVYRAGEPTAPTKYRSGEQANAEPALPGWQMAVDEVFESQ